MKNISITAIIVALVGIVNILLGMSYLTILQLDLKIGIFLLPFLIFFELFPPLKRYVIKWWHARKKKKAQPQKQTRSGKIKRKSKN